MSSAQEIAAKLTLSERSAVIGSRWRWLSHRQALEWSMCGTVERMPENSSYWQATSLGLVVRVLALKDPLP